MNHHSFKQNIIHVFLNHLCFSMGILVWQWQRPGSSVLASPRVDKVSEILQSHPPRSAVSDENPTILPSAEKNRPKTDEELDLIIKWDTKTKLGYHFPRNWLFDREPYDGFL